VTFTIAVAGKGGVGKSTLSALMTLRLAKEDGSPVLAVDADPNSNLGDKLGVRVERTVGSMREAVAANEADSAGSKHETVMYHLRMSVLEADGFDLVTMGRPEGQGCYCYVNGLLRSFLDEMMGRYRFALIDNEAGLEHLSRRTCRAMDVLLVVSDATRTGLETAGRVLSLSKEMGIDVKRSALAINRHEGPLPHVPEGFDLVAALPHDEAVWRASMDGAPLTALPQDSALIAAVDSLLRQLAPLRQ